MIEQRRYARTPIGAPLFFSIKGAPEPREGLARDISLGGMFLETAEPAPFGAEVVVRLVVPGSSEEVALPGIVRWVRDGGMGVQFGLIGARETFLITELARKSG